MAQTGETVGGNATILVVDDQEEILQSLGTLLEGEGHTVLTASSAADALELFGLRDVELLLVDDSMPRATGADLIREIRGIDPFVPIILQTDAAVEKPARRMIAELDIQGCHDKSEGAEKLLLWVDVALKAHTVVRRLHDGERLQRELVANVSHELRTPLNIILGYSDLLIDGDFGQLPDEAIDALQRLTGATNDLSALVSDLLSYAKIEAGGTDTDFETVDTSKIAGELERLTGLFLDNKTVDFELDVAQAPASFESDVAKLRVILRNLVSNASKFTTEGSVSVRGFEQGDRLCFSVSDTGPGIRAEHLDVIFDPFRQVNGSAVRLHRGIGLGLALSRKLADLLRGEITVESEVGKGATFTLAIPKFVSGDPSDRRPGSAARAHVAA